jgi:hypothetical protein
VRSLGGGVIVSFGCASRIELAQACPGVASLTREYQAVVSAYALKYVDFDIEGVAVAEPASQIGRFGHACAVGLIDLATLNGAQIGTAVTFAPPSQSVEATGAKVPPTVGPSGGYELVLGIRALQKGQTTFRDITVDYHIDGRKYRLTGPHSFRLCTPATEICQF